MIRPNWSLEPWRRTLVAVTACLAAACGSTGATASGPIPTTVTVSPATHPLVALGDTLSLSAAVKDQDGNPIVGLAVSWTSLTPTVATVAGGIVTAVKNGSAQIQATAESATGQATVVVQQVPAALIKASGDTQGGVISQPLGQPLVVVVNDGNGHAIPGTGVAFSVVRGGGSAPLAVATDSLGHAQAGWTLGDSVGRQVLIANLSVPALADTFFATATDGLEPLPVDVATVQSAIDFMTSQPISVPPDCTSTVTIDCTGGMAGSPVPLSVTEDSTGISEPMPGTFVATAWLKIESQAAIPVNIAGTDCGLAVNTSGGSLPDAQLTVTATFSRAVPSDSFDRIDLVVSTVTGLEDSDFALTGGIVCAVEGVALSFLEGALVDIVSEDFQENASALCGAPGPDLLEVCPPIAAVGPSPRRDGTRGRTVLRRPSTPLLHALGPP